MKFKAWHVTQKCGIGFRQTAQFNETAEQFIKQQNSLGSGLAVLWGLDSQTNEWKKLFPKDEGQ